MRTLSALLFVLGLAACEAPKDYPVSGEECGPADPVQTLSADNCGAPT